MPLVAKVPFPVWAGAAHFCTTLNGMFIHDRDWEKFGLTAPLEHKLWEVLKAHPKGLTTGDIHKELGGVPEDKQVLLFVTRAYLSEELLPACHGMVQWLCLARPALLRWCLLHIVQMLGNVQFVLRGMWYT